MHNGTADDRQVHQQPRRVCRIGSLFDFSLEGRNYQIDLSDDNAAKLRDALAPYIGAARKSGGRGRGRTPRQTAVADKPARSSREETAAIRGWARENGHQVQRPRPHPLPALRRDPFPFRAADGRIFIFYRETLDRIDSQYLDDDRPLRYVVSADNGLTWRNSNELTDDFFALGSVDRVDNMDEIYVGQVRYLPATGTRRERVLISWTIAGGGLDDNKHDRYHRNMYVAYFRPYDLHFESVAGKDLGTQLTNDEMEADAKVLDTGEPKFAMDSDDFDTHDVDYVSVVDERADGKPVVMFTMFDGKNLITHYDVWTGTAWQDKTGDFGQPTDMELRGSVLQAYVSDPGQYESWVMTGDDDTFRPGVVHRFNESKAKNGIETLIENYRQPLQFISGGRGFEGVSDASPELDVGVIGVP